MWFWVFMFICNLLIPFLMIAFGWIMLKHPPKSINGIYGYRTSMSMKNMDTWQFAHAYCGRLWWKTGWILLIFSMIIQLPFLQKDEKIVGTIGGILCMIQCFLLILSIFPVEKALKANFNRDGSRKQNDLSSGKKGV